MAKDLVFEMAKKDKSTVPYVNGKTTNYIYSVYDSQDENILLAGINTDSCFRIDGNDNDFLHYCALNKNGFVLKITDSFGNFIARASGFRNGNGIYFNQLRTIYDEGGYGYKGEYKNELSEIIETFKKACQEIIETSRNNKEEQDKIEFILITKSYALEKIESNVDRSVVNKIGNKPMDTKSDDWKNFVNNTKNLKEIDDTSEPFSTDYGNYSLICMASNKLYSPLKPKDIKPKDVEAVYNRPRNKIIITEKINTNIINKINKINAMYSYHNKIKFESISIPSGATIFIGDNWYIIYNNGHIIKSCLLDFDDKAKIEFNATKQTIINNPSQDIKQINYEEKNNNSQKQKNNILTRILKLKKPE